MKYAIVIPDGCADEPQASLGGKTPLQAAHLPNMDHIAQIGVVGRSNNVPPPLTPASDVATLSLFGYDPLVVYTGRAPLETAAMGIRLGPRDWAIRCNLVNVDNEEMRDFTAGHIGNDEGKELIAAIRASPGWSSARSTAAAQRGAGVSPWRQLSQHFGLSRGRLGGAIRRGHQNPAAARHSRQTDRRPTCRKGLGLACSTN